jgi:hypothetical protein
MEDLYFASQERDTINSFPNSPKMISFILLFTPPLTSQFVLYMKITKPFVVLRRLDVSTSCMLYAYTQEKHSLSKDALVLGVKETAVRGFEYLGKSIQGDFGVAW